MVTKNIQTQRKARGRPSSFDRETALMAAMRLFWDRGYEGTSFDDLTAVMGISASSFYNSFGSKEALYHEAIDAYARQASAWFVAALETGQTTADAFRALFEAAACAFTRCDSPSGCMIASAATQCSPAQSRLKELMIDQRRLAEDAMKQRLALGVKAGDLAPTTDLDALAGYFSTVMQGLGIQARDGASREKLIEIGHMALSVFKQ
ncbi:TetR/AcrR family transcriptional regulator [Asaia siamensis]|uniref:TetR family transcriptional regulator n=1 Tax=Asaia siamensis TaxID=110479 RepID=A0ABQ1LYL7_9PROT|nr:TetR/AcrR family transcriptional regulator [Asaia siamensis]GBR02853.1 transcriptional regulator [Asaia siamensis NRIC 0323]GGC30727.1 TetR family transcriptional regulator [Asaia siamensis]